MFTFYNIFRGVKDKVDVLVNIKTFCLWKYVKIWILRRLIYTCIGVSYNILID